MARAFAVVRAPSRRSRALSGLVNPAHLQGGPHAEGHQPRRLHRPTDQGPRAARHPVGYAGLHAARRDPAPPGREGADRGAAFYDLEVWNGLAETCARYLAKGRRVAVEARLEHDEWKTDGATRERNYLVGEEVKFLDAPPETGKQPAETPQADPEPAVA